jgi:hypothetical protein
MRIPICTMFVVVLALTGSCSAESDDDQDGSPSAGTNAGASSDGGSNGGGIDRGGAPAGAPNSGGAPGYGGLAAGAGGSSGTCEYRCSSLNETACELDSGCVAIDGTRWAEAGPASFAGCHTLCCAGDDCEEPVVATVCGHPPDAPNECWSIPSGVLPDHWVLLSDVEGCEAFPQCE